MYFTSPLLASGVSLAESFESMDREYHDLWDEVNSLSDTLHFLTSYYSRYRGETFDNPWDFHSLLANATGGFSTQSMPYGGVSWLSVRFRELLWEVDNLERLFPTHAERVEDHGLARLLFVYRDLVENLDRRVYLALQLLGKLRAGAATGTLLTTDKLAEDLSALRLVGRLRSDVGSARRLLGEAVVGFVGVAKKTCSAEHEAELVRDMIHDLYEFEGGERLVEAVSGTRTLSWGSM